MLILLKARHRSERDGERRQPKGSVVGPNEGT